MILVTGASGLLGVNLLCRARDRGLEATGLCHRHILRVPGLSTFSVDLADDSASRNLLLRLRPRAIVHCAAATNVDWCEDHPAEAEKLNAKVSGDLAGIASELDARFLYVSTDAIFDGRTGNYSEEDRPSPINVYARSKLCGETQVSERHPRAAIVRLTLYGWNAQNKLSLAEWALKRLKEGAQVPGFTDVYFNPLPATDLADTFLAMLEHDLAGVYHLGSAERVSKYDFIRLVAEVFGFERDRVLPARLADAGLRAQRALDTSLDTTKIRNALRCELPDVLSGIRNFRAQQGNGYSQRLKSYLTGERQ
jgi:dTDP-4-dehydrorhamnose reductase